MFSNSIFRITLCLSLLRVIFMSVIFSHLCVNVFS